MAIAMSPDRCGTELAKILNAQAEICQEILQLSQRQQKMVEERLEDELLDLLNDKQRLIDQQQALAKDSQPLRQQWENEGGRASAAVHQTVEAAWNGLRSVLDQIVKLEDASRAILEEQQGKVTLDISNVQKGKIVNKAYGGGVLPPPTARFSDQQG